MPAEQPPPVSPKELFDGFDDIFYVKDSSGRYLFISRSGARRLGRSIADILGRHDGDLLGADLARARADQEKQAIAGDETRMVEQTWPADEGTEAYWAQLTPYRDQAGRILGVVGIARRGARGDSTQTQGAVQHISLHHHLRDCLESLAEAQTKLHRILADRAGAGQQAPAWAMTSTPQGALLGNEALAAGIAHELKQPLLAIMSYGQACLDVVRSRPDKDEQLVPALEGIVAQVERAAEILHHMPSLVYNSAPDTTTVDVNELIRGTLPLVRDEAKLWGVTLRFEFAESLPLVSADPVQIQQVIVNLVFNAIEAMGRSTGRKLLTITTAHNTSQHVEILVADTGPGLPSTIRRRLFKPFVTTKLGGNGLGLAISRAIVDSHGGQLWEKDNEQNGATFILSLPLAGDIDPPDA